MTRLTYLLLGALLDGWPAPSLTRDLFGDPRTLAARLTMAESERSPAACRRLERCCLILERKHVRAVPMTELPSHWHRAPSCPPLLFLRGQLAALARPGCAIVGARRASPDAVRWAERRAELAAADSVVVSGGARGIDGAAHRGALHASGATLAILGVAADRIYPLSHGALFQRILENGGALVSEHPPGAATRGYHHASRNRLIAAASSHVVVVEAATNSGSLQTARFAARMGTSLEVSPENIGLLRDGLDELRNSGAEMSRLL